MTVATHKVEFPNADGTLLAGRLELPAEEPLGWALFAHCFTGGKDIPVTTRLCRGLGKRGYAVLRFDFTGLGNSEGDFGNSNFSSNVGDLLAAAHFLGEHYESPRLLVGHSWGGAASLLAAAQLPDVRAVATIAAPSDPAHITTHFREELARVTPEACVEIELGGRRFPICQQFLDDLEQHHLEGELKKLRCATMVLHSPVDSVVGIDHARKLFDWVPHPKSFVSLDNADHLLRRAADVDWVAAILAGWAGRYLDDRRSPSTG